LPLPDAYRVESKLTNAGVIVPCPRGRYGRDWEEEPVSLSGETYLRLADVDLDDSEAIFDFVSQYGVLGGEHAYYSFMRQAAYRFSMVYGGQLNWEFEQGKKTQALREERSDPSNSVWPSETLRLHYTETVEEFRFAARFLRDLTSAWRMFQDGGRAADAQWLSPDQSDPELLSDDAFPLFLLEHFLSDFFLQPFSPHLLFHWSPPLRAGPITNLPARASGASVDPQRRPAASRLYTICALELFNHIVENAEYRICANDRCQRTFVRQIGRAEKGQHRSRGVLYCTPACARAAAQREYRRRQRQAERAT
jgi:hypothetical protein